MGSICILTDSAAQFPQYGFNGKNDVRVIPFHVDGSGTAKEDGREYKVADLPASAIGTGTPRLAAPSAAEYQELFLQLSPHYRDIIAILTSSSLTQSFENARQASESVRGRVRITLIDSQTISIGLGLLVQSAAEAVSSGEPVAEVEHLIRSLVPHTYMMLCTPGMSYLHQAGFVDSSQAFVCELMGMMPIFTIEEGQLSPVEKVRNMRGLIDFMQEFVLEFDDLKHIAFLQSTPSLSHEARIMREHAQSCFPQTPFSELNISLPLALLTGPRTTGLVAIEKPESGRFK